ncbi:hypothetical protein B9Z55_013808 [Caenorhabditis nigoni]|uniref:Uncharacterized protein n=1 Tax=Caenorhabditis nigoni TaxID=1611254 RepID=A0A2G5U477_9PELO|nr:hypothetical protein B9Z55_013808 [Caenorhabditis nigoni]
MQSEPNKDPKFLREVLSSLNSSPDGIISAPFFMMSDEFQRQNVLNFAMGLLRKALLDSRVGWVLRAMFGPKERALTAEEIISLNSRPFPQNSKLPDNFLEIFKGLPRVPMENMLRELGWKDIYNLQLVAGPFTQYVENGRRNYPMNELVQGAVKLNGTESVTVLRFNRRLTINHEQFSKSLRTVNMRTLLIKQAGTVRAASFHIPELRCFKLEIRFYRPIDEQPEAEDELAQVMEQIIVNPHISHLNIICRRFAESSDLSDRLYEIARRGPHLTPALTHISIIPP